MDGADIIAEILITAAMDQDTDKPKKGCLIWLVIFLIALGIWLGYEYYIK